MKVGLDLCNYATKAGLKNETGVETLKLPKTFDLANLKPSLDELDFL